ncbi:MAG: DUF975 family protein [Bacteroidaceae bacterium]|nr:DUF975 family protein [Bacteroidaceae bacterium]
MGKNQTLKNRALASLEGKWTNAIVATIIYLLITGCVGQGVTTIFDGVTGYGISGFWTLLCLPMGWGITAYFLNLIRNEDIAYERLFDGYKDFVRIFLAEFLVVVCIAIGFMLLIIPGIILALMFCQTEYILKDDKQISAADAMKKSAEMMNGHKMEFFWLLLSFIGWLILSFLTLGFGFIFLQPYMETTFAHYYEDLKAQQAA